MRLRSASLLIVVLCLAAAGCEEGQGALELRIELIDEDGQNAAADISEGTLEVTIRQGDVLLGCADGPCTGAVQGGTFDLPVPLESLRAPTRIQLRLEGGGAPRLGATPPFGPTGEGLETGETPLRVLMRPASTCVVLDVPPAATQRVMGLTQARRDAIAVNRRNTTAIVGGVSDSGASDRFDFYDRVATDVRPMLMPLTRPQGRLQGIALGEDLGFVLGDGGWLIELQPMLPPGLREVPLHDAASADSALVGLGFNGFALVGGDDTARVGWYATTGALLSEALMITRRTAPLAARHRAGVLVVGGEAPGEPAVEWLSVRDNGQVFGAPGAPVGMNGGWLLHSPNHDSALWIGADGGEETYLYTCDGCPVERGPRWERARQGAVGARTEAGRFWIVGGEGSDAIDIVEWDEEERPSIVAGPDLVVARAGAAVFEHAAGVITVAGGEGPDGLRTDFEQCVPAGLDPIL